MGFRLIATGGTQRELEASGLSCDRVNKVLEGRPHIVDAIHNGDVALVINTSEGKQAVHDSFSLRRAALAERVPYYTTIAGAKAAVQAIAALREGDLEVSPLQDYFDSSF
jgi:carbamoyl-phosphate synthase large subunit